MRVKVKMKKMKVFCFVLVKCLILYKALEQVLIYLLVKNEINRKLMYFTGIFYFLTKFGKR